MAAEEAIAQEPQVQEEERERSTIGFPYADLDDAVQIAGGVHAVGGSSCDWDQLAAQLNQAANGGGFRQRMLTAKMFGLVTYTQGRVTLTALGSRMCDPQQERAARVDAFQNVPLYKAVYDRFKGGTLPPSAGLEAEMVTLGVAKKQKDKARQVFQRSAQQAGYFWSGTDRLVMPSIRNGGETRREPEIEKQKDPPMEEGGGGDGGGKRHPFIEGLIKTLPPANQPWTLEKRAQWLQAAVSVFNLIYPDDSSGTIDVKFQKGNTA